MVRIGFVVAKFNHPITDRMEDEARGSAAELDVQVVETIRVPGSFDTPLAADRLARREDIDAVVVIGAIISGETDHEYMIGNAVAQGITDVSIDRDTPVALGISGPGMSAEQATDRIGYGAQAVESAVKLVEALR